MIKIQPSQGIFIALLLASSAAGAEQYPAANFQPKVIYTSEEVATATPASNSPCVPKVEQSAFDPKYPAASFQPKVIYSNTDAKQGS